MDNKALIEQFRLARHDPELAVLEGFHALKHALRFKAQIITAVCTDPEKIDQLAKKLAPELNQINNSLTVVTPEIFNQLAPRPPSTGLIAVAKRPKIDLAAVLGSQTPKPLILLENPRNLANVGACVRVAAAADAAALITSGTNDPWHPDALRAAAGLHYALPVSRVDSLPVSNRPLIAIDPSGEALRPDLIPQRAILAFGTERYGLSDALLKQADSIVSIPMRPGVSSLNLATSVAAILYTQKLSNGLNPKL